jgi:hypothetical protein
MIAACVLKENDPENEIKMVGISKSKLPPHAGPLLPQPSNDEQDRLDGREPGSTTWELKLVNFHSLMLGGGACSCCRLCAFLVYLTLKSILLSRTSSQCSDNERGTLT